MDKRISGILLTVFVTAAMVSSCGGLVDNGEQDGKAVVFRDGSLEHPFLVGDIAPGGDVCEYYCDSQENVWVEGYIVGYVNGTKMSSVVFEAGSKESNVVIGDEADSPSHLIPVQLSSGSDDSKAVRSALNLSDNPSNIGRRVSINGRICTYMSTTGIKPAVDYSWNE